jgi:hypothetical protein
VRSWRTLCASFCLLLLGFSHTYKCSRDILAPWRCVCLDKQCPGWTLAFPCAQVEPDRWYYHCDRLGMLVWQDMPSMYWEDPFSAGPGFRAPSEKRQFEHELTRLIEVSLPLDPPFTDCKVMLVWQDMPSMYWEDPFSVQTS